MKKQMKFVLLSVIFLSLTATSSSSPAQTVATIWSEDFSSSFEGQTDETGAWWSTYTGDTVYWSVQSETPTSTNLIFRGWNNGTEGIWGTETIDISSYRDIQISIDLAEAGSLTGSDYVQFLYQTDGGEVEWYYHTGELPGGTTWVTQTVGGINGDSLFVKFKGYTTLAAGKFWRFDDIAVTGTPQFILIDQVCAGPDYDYVVLWNPMDTDFNLGTNNYVLNNQDSPGDPSDDYIFTSCDIIPATGYFMVASTRYPGGGDFNLATADAVANINIIADSAAGNSWVQLTDSDGQVDAVGWASGTAPVPPEHYEGDYINSGLSGAMAWFRGAYHADSNDNAADFYKDTHIPISSGNISTWYCHTMWGVEDTDGQEWTMVCSSGCSYYYQAIDNKNSPMAEPYLLSDSGSGTPQAWFGLADFPWDSLVDCWGRTHVELVAWGVQTGAYTSPIYIKSGGTESSRLIGFSTETAPVRSRPWATNPDGGGLWDDASLDNLEMGVENNDIGIRKIVTRMYAVAWYTGTEPSPTECFDVRHSSLLSAQTDSTALIDTGLSATAGLPADGAIAVFCSLGSEWVSGTTTGSWDLRMDNTWSSQTIQRYLSGSNDLGQAGAVHVFGSLSSGSHTVRLRHATSDSSNPIKTRDADLIALPLTGWDGTTVLNYGLDSLGEGGDTTTFAALTDIIGLSASVTLDASGRIFVAAALNAESQAGAGKTGTWDLQVDGSTVGTAVSRYLSGTSDLGAMMLVGLSDILSSGTYTIKARHATSSGTLKTMNATLVGIALSDNGPSLGTALYSKQVTFTTQTGTTFTDLTDIAWSENTMYSGTDDKILVAASFTTEHGSGVLGRTAKHDITVNSDTVTEEGSRYLSGADDKGVSGLFGLSDSLTAGTQTGFVRHATSDVSQEILTGDLTFIMLGTCCNGSPTAVLLKELKAEGYDGLVAVTWETGAEIDNLGFYLHRARLPRGPYERVSEDFILSMGNGPGGASYLFIDRQVENGGDYYYKLEAVDYRGESVFYGPVRATPQAGAGAFSYNPADYSVVVETAVIPFPTPSPVALTGPSPTASPAYQITPLPTPTPCFRFTEVADYNGDGTSDIAVFKVSNGVWLVRGVTRVYYGSPSDIPIPGDYNGDGVADIAIFRGLSGLWGVRGLTRLYYGSSSDIPVPGDYDGDGSCDLGIFRSSVGLWGVAGLTRAYFGSSGDIPAPGDYDGDGTKDIALFRGSGGLWALRSISRIYFGSFTDAVVPGDYNGNGTWEVGIFRSSTGMWGIRGVTRVYYGSSIDQPVPADYNGDSADDIGIFRGSSGLWGIRNISRVYYGSSGDIPVTR